MFLRVMILRVMILRVMILRVCFLPHFRAQSAQREIALWFQPSELAAYELTNRLWAYES